MVENSREIFMAVKYSNILYNNIFDINSVVWIWLKAKLNPCLEKHFLYFFLQQFLSQVNLICLSTHGISKFLILKLSSKSRLGTPDSGVQSLVRPTEHIICYVTYALCYIDYLTCDIDYVGRQFERWAAEKVVLFANIQREIVYESQWRVPRHGAIRIEKKRIDSLPGPLKEASMETAF